MNAWPRITVPAFLLAGAIVSSGPAMAVTINGAIVAAAETRPAITVDVAEYRDGTSNFARLLPGNKHYALSVVSRDPIAVLDAQLPVDAAPAQFTIGADGGRTYLGCVVAGLSSEGSGGGYRYVYALRCVDVS